MIRVLLAFVLVLMLAPTSKAQTLGPDGYYYFSGYAEPYTRTWISTGNAYYSCGRYYPASGYYSYSVYSKPTLLAAPDFETQVLGLIKQREEKAYRLKVLQSLGVNAYGAPQNSYLTSASFSGATLYGYKQSVNDIVKVDQSIDANVLLLQMDQNVKGAAALHGQVLGGQQQIVAQVAADQAAKDERQARIAAAVKLLEGPAVLSTQKAQYNFSSQPAPNPQVNPQALPLPKEAAPGLERLGAFFNASCAACHGAEKQEGGLDLRNWQRFTDEQKAKVMVRINLPTSDPKFMPRLVADPSKPGKPATREEKQAVLEN